MKEILIDINDLTDSREMYRSKPHSFVWVFTYIIIALVIAAVLWASFGKKEIVIKASGQVRPEAGISTVNNIFAGEIESINYKQGMPVKAGDILYIIKHDKLLMEKEANNIQLADLRKELSNLNMYRKSIISGTNEFDKISEPMYYEKVQKLLMDIHYTQSDTNYKMTKLKEERSINNSQLSDYQTEVACLKNYIKSLDDNKNYLVDNGEIARQYSQKYENYIISQKDIERKFNQQANEIKKNSFDIDKTISEKIKVAELESSVSGTLDEATLLELNDKDKESAIKKLYINERQAASDLMDNLTNSINSLKHNIALGEAELKTISEAAGNNNNNINYSVVERTKSQEIITTDEKIKNISDSISAIEQNIKKLQLDVDSAIVRANIDGVVNVVSQIYEGDFVASGSEILTVIPDKNSSFTMQIHVNNQDIGELHIGDAVKYSFAALSYREYGQVTGKITSISKDSIIDKNTGQSFYVAYATVPNTKLFTKAGKQGDVKLGMLCEANVVTKQKSYLNYFLEKINLLE